MTILQSHGASRPGESGIRPVRIDIAVELDYQVDQHGADFIFNIQAARTRNQQVVTESLAISQDCEMRYSTDAATATRCMQLHAAQGDLHVRYQATVELQHHLAEPHELGEVPVRHLPPHALTYLYPSRYCQSDRLLRFAADEFGQLPQGYARVRSICNWVKSHVRFVPNSTDSSTSAVDTLVQRVGVCRDYAHLMIGLCRALNIPSRFVTGTDFGCDASLGPPDFHAYVEVFLGDRWYLFDPSGMTMERGLIRIATGRDAADASFATIFGTVLSWQPRIRASASAEDWEEIARSRGAPRALSVDGR